MFQALCESYTTDDGVAVEQVGDVNKTTSDTELLASDLEMHILHTKQSTSLKRPGA
jgi:hypothetical protein